MDNELLIVFPQGKQLEYIAQIVDEQMVIYIVLQNTIPEHAWLKKTNFVYVDKECSKNEICKIIPSKVRVLCCHEEALYWLKNKGQENWNYSFDNIIFKHLTKVDFKKYIKENGITIANIFFKKEDINNFPVILKPSIGFGSIGVKKINNMEELEFYEKNYNNEINRSRIAQYANKYFEFEDNSYIFETFISGDFYRVPFLVCDGKIRNVFPVRGISKTIKEISDFHWTEFEYGENERILAKRMKNLLQSVIELYKAYNGSFIAEIMIDNNGNLYLLEFSPRQTSSRISKLIYYATGVDLEQGAIDIIFSKKSFVSLHNKNVKLLIHRGKKINEDIMGYRLIEKEVDHSVFNDDINILYYEKE